MNGFTNATGAVSAAKPVLTVSSVKKQMNAGVFIGE
jgi:hypothetical protein